jgi:hypothetical protein
VFFLSEDGRLKFWSWDLISNWVSRYDAEHYESDIRQFMKIGSAFIQFDKQVLALFKDETL